MARDELDRVQNGLSPPVDTVHSMLYTRTSETQFNITTKKIPRTPKVAATTKSNSVTAMTPKTMLQAVNAIRTGIRLTGAITNMP